MTPVTDPEVSAGATGAITSRGYALALVVFAAAVLLATAGLAAASLARQEPPAPRSIQASAGQTGTVAVVSWAPPSQRAGVVAHRVWRADSDGVFAPVGSVSAEATSFADRSGVPGASYSYRVTAVDADGVESPPSLRTATITVQWTVSPHVGDRLGAGGVVTCRLCHVSHAAESGVALLREDSVRVGQLGICYRCHDGSGAKADVANGPYDSFALASGHTLEALADGGDQTNECGDCHHLHGSAAERPGLAARVVTHSSIGTRAVEGRVSLCLACHDDEASWFTFKNGAYPSRAQAPVDGSGYPLLGTFPGPRVYRDAAKNPHASIPAAPREGRERGDCLYCHAAHRGPSRYDGLKALFRPSTPETLDADRESGAYAALCFMCHGGSRPSYLATIPTDIKRFALGGGRNAGHRVQASGAALPVGAALPCYECHNPHGSAAPVAGLEVVAVVAPGRSVLVGDEPGEIVMGPSATPADVRRFCLTCHTTADSAMGWDGRAMSAVAPGARVLGIERTSFGAVLRLPDIRAHRLAETRSCYECHGADYSAANSFNVHNPTFGKPPGEVQCDVCHSSAPSGSGAASDEGAPMGSAEPSSP